jgi:hypothetical protein
VEFFHFLVRIIEGFNYPTGSENAGTACNERDTVFRREV